MRREVVLLAEVIEAAERAQALAAGAGLDTFDDDRTRRDALLWNFTVLGEACSQLPVDFKDAHPHIPWSRPSQLRNRIVHGYWSIDLEILIATAQDDLADFVTEVRAVVAGLG